MIIARPEDSIHRSNLHKLLIEVIDNEFLGQSLYFKGGTCATMLGFLDRLSLDLDFDLKKEVEIERYQKRIDKSI